MGTGIYGWLVFMVTVVCILVGGLVSAHLKKYAVSQIGSSLVSGFGVKFQNMFESTAWA